MLKINNIKVYDLEANFNIDKSASKDNGLFFTNKKSTFFLFIYSDKTDKISPEYINLLKVIKALKDISNNFNIINVLENPTLTFDEISKNKSIKKAIFFGRKTVVGGLPFKTSYNKIESFNNNKYLFTYDLTTVSNTKDKGIKERTWAAIQTIYNM